MNRKPCILRSLILPLKQTDWLNQVLKACDLPHRKLLRVLAKNDRDREHIQKVVESMINLMDANYLEIFEPECLATNEQLPRNELANLDSIVNKLDDVDDDAKDFLLWCALYHDIGKAILRPRHGPEGADVIKDSDYKERGKFYDIGFFRSEIFFLSDLLRFHDYLAMVGTGETSYLTFAEVLYPITNISIIEDNFLDYLFLLNLADVAGTLGKVRHESFSMFIRDFKLIRKVHSDISEKVYQDIFKQKCKQVDEEVHRKTIPARDIIDVTTELQRTAENSTSERLRRMLRAGFRVSLENLEKTLGQQALNEYRQWVIDVQSPVGKFQQIKRLDDWFAGDDIIPVIASLRSLNVKQDFYQEFALVCKFDYLLSFLGEFFAEMIKVEINQSQKVRPLKSPHDLRRDMALYLVKVINILLYQFGNFTANDTRIGLGFERCTQMEQEHKKRFFQRLAGEHGGFKEAEAYRKLVDSTNMWVFTP